MKPTRLSVALLALLTCPALTRAESKTATEAPRQESLAGSFYFSTQYLNWEVRKAPVPVPLVTLGNLAEFSPSGGAGALNFADTQILIGAADVDFGRVGGGRFTLGLELPNGGTA